MTGPSANGSNGDGTFDLEAAAAAEAEAAPFPFTYKDKAYTLPPMGGWSLTSIRAVALGNLEDALAELIGPATYEGLCADGLKLGELTALFKASGATVGMANLPNSGQPARRASTRTSKRR